MKESLASGSEVVNVPTVEPVGRFSARVEEESVMSVGAALPSLSTIVRYEVAVVPSRLLLS